MTHLVILLWYNVIMNTLEMLEFAEENNIPVYHFKTHNKKAFCTADAIALDFCRVESERECKMILSEEIGHIMTGALYPLYYCGNPLFSASIAKQEKRAYDYSLTLQIPLNDLKLAITTGSTDFEIAEMLDVDITTLHEAVDYYKRKGMLE